MRRAANPEGMRHAGLVQDSGFALVLHGNAFEGPERRRRRRRPGALRRIWRALCTWLAQPSPWRRTP